MGQVLQAGQGQIPSRQAQIKGGIPKEVPSETVNKVCASGVRAVALIDTAVRAGDLDTAVAGGMESMIGDRTDARCADLVDGLRGHLLRDAALDLCLPRGDLALAGLEHLAHHDLLHLLGLDFGTLERGGDRHAAEVGRVEVASAPPSLPNGVRAAPRITVSGIMNLLSGERRHCGR